MKTCWTTTNFKNKDHQINWNSEKNFKIFSETVSRQKLGSSNHKDNYENGSIIDFSRKNIWPMKF